MSSGIYKITNLINGKIYIGQSTNIEERWKKEKQRAFYKNSIEYNSPRSQDFREYGLENFTFEIVENIDPNNKKLLAEKEVYYIDLYNSLYPKGYNLTRGGTHACSQKLSLSQVEEITSLLKNTDLTNIEIKDIFGVSENMICGINTGYYWHRENIDYPIRKKR